MPSSSIMVACSTDATPARIAFLMPSAECACDSTRKPKWLASSTAACNSSGVNRDVIHAVVSQLTDHLPHLPGTVRLTVMKVPGKLNVWGEARHRTCATRDRNVGTRYKHSRSFDISLRNRISKRNIIQCSINANITYC